MLSQGIITRLRTLNGRYMLLCHLIRLIDVVQHFFSVSRSDMMLVGSLSMSPLKGLRIRILTYKVFWRPMDFCGAVNNAALYWQCLRTCSGNHNCSCIDSDHITQHCRLYAHLGSQDRGCKHLDQQFKDVVFCSEVWTCSALFPPTMDFQADA
jgi:hypothetical protein